MSVISNFLYDHFDVGNNPYRSVHCRITTEFGKVVQRRLPAESGYLIDENAKNAYFLDHAGEIPLRGEKYTELILDERDAYPWTPEQKASKSKRDQWQTTTINTISANEFARQKNQAEAKVIKDKNARIILLIFALVAIVMVLMIVMIYVTNVLL